jgi:hypothetical protein
MIFNPKHINKIIAGTKTQTRRIKKANEVLYITRYVATGEIYSAEVVIAANGKQRRKWYTGKDYAVVPGRGKKAVMVDWIPVRIKITAIRKERLHDIAECDAIKEGVTDVYEYSLLWDSINKKPGTRWDDNPMVWVIDFKMKARR